MGADRMIREGLVVDDAGGPHLVGGSCADCARHHFPLATSCPYCASQSVTSAALSAEGRLWAWTAVTAAPPGYRGEVPYGFGVVELPEALRVVTRLTEPDPSRLRMDEPMHLVVVPLHSDEDGTPVVTYAFAPDGRA